jgi:hypothetical protein
MYSTHHWLDKLDTVVLGRVVGCCDHNTDPFALQCSRSEGSDETNACEDRVKDIAAAVSFLLRGWRWAGVWRALRLGTELYRCQLAWLRTHSMALLTPAVPYV